jgi:hypothetical protein
MIICYNIYLHICTRSNNVHSSHKITINSIASSANLDKVFRSGKPEVVFQLTSLKAKPPIAVALGYFYFIYSTYLFNDTFACIWLVDDWCSSPMNTCNRLSQTHHAFNASGLPWARTKRTATRWSAILMWLLKDGIALMSNEKTFMFCLSVRGARARRVDVWMVHDLTWRSQ